MSNLPALPPETYDRFDNAKGYKRWLFRASRGLQSPELNEVQDAIIQERRNFLDAEYGDGAMIAGGLFNRVAVQGTHHVWRGDAGTFYAQAFTHLIATRDLTVAQVGDPVFPQGETCSIGVILHVDVIDEFRDSGLLDNAVGTKNFGQAGAARMRYVARFGKQTEALPEDWFYSRVDFVGGLPTGGNNTDQSLLGLLDLLATYDRNANGNYIVRGNYVSWAGDDANASAHILQVSAGQSNVFGYMQKLPFAYNVNIPFATDTKQVLNEPITFTGPGVYPLRNTPIAAVGPEVNGIAEVTQNVVHGAFLGAVDQLSNTPVVSISLVTQGATTYVQGVDYAQSGDRITWLRNDNQPSPGSTYTVTYRYSAVFTPTITADLTGINVSGLAPNTVFFVDYTYYVPRYDIVVIDQGLKITATKGTPSANPVPPTHSTGLLLGTVYVSFGNPPRITLSDQRRPLTSDLVTIQHSLDDIKYNLARLQLQERLTSQDPVTVMKGIFVDPFTADTFRDAGIAQSAEISAGILYMAVPWTYIQVTDPNVLRYRTTLNYTTTTLTSQLMHSREFQVNQFVGVGAPPATVTTWPAQVTWIDQAISRSVRANPQFIPYWAIGGVPAGVPWAGPPGDPRNQSASTNVIASTYTEIMITQPIPIPVTRINFTGKIYNRGETVSVMFDNRMVGTTPANAQGEISGSFQTPPGTLSGVKPISFVGQESGVVGTSSFRAVPFASTTTDVIQDTVYYDPLAETFGPTRDAFITDVTVWIERIPGKPRPGPSDFIDCLLVETEVGLPDRASTVGFVRLYDNQIADADPAPYRPTKFTFPEPIRIDGSRQYAFVLATPNGSYSAWGITLGDYDLTYGRWISAKPTLGTMLESSNSVTWLPRLKDDLTYVVGAAQFSPTRTVTYPTVQVAAVTDLMLLANVDTPSGTSIRFTATLTVGGRLITYPITPDAPLTIPLYTGPVTITAVLATNNPYITPSIDASVSLAVAQVTNPSTYVTRSIPVPANAAAVATTVKVYLEIGEADPNTVLVEYLSADGTTWRAFTRDVTHATQLGFGIVDMPLVTSSTAMVGATQTRVRITLSSLDPTRVRRSFAKNLRLYFA